MGGRVGTRVIDPDAGRLTDWAVMTWERLDIAPHADGRRSRPDRRKPARDRIPSGRMA